MPRTVVDYTIHSLDDLRIIVVSLSLSLTSCEKEVIANSFGSSYQEQIVEMISKQLLTNPLRSWYEKSISHQKTTGISPPENVALKIVLIQLKIIPPK